VGGVAQPDWWLEETPWHAGLQQLVRDLNRLYRSHPQLWTLDNDPAGFEWIDANDAPHNTFSFIRKDPQGRPLVCVANFAGTPDEGYRVGLPRAGRWLEILNTDGEGYGGSGVGNLGAVTAEDISWHGRPASASLRVPPLGTVWLVPDDGGDIATAVPVAAKAAPAPALPSAPPTPATGIPSAQQSAAPPEWVKELAERQHGNHGNHGNRPEQARDRRPGPEPDAKRDPDGPADPEPGPKSGPKPDAKRDPDGPTGP
jgi:hypothetical protein